MVDYLDDAVVIACACLFPVLGSIHQEIIGAQCLLVAQLGFNSAFDGVIESKINKEFELCDHLQGEILPEQPGGECFGFSVGLEAKVNQITAKEIIALS